MYMINYIEHYLFHDKDDTTYDAMVLTLNISSKNFENEFIEYRCDQNLMPHPHF